MDTTEASGKNYGFNREEISSHGDFKISSQKISLIIH